MADSLASIRALFAAGPAGLYADDPDDPAAAERGPATPDARGTHVRLSNRLFRRIAGGWQQITPGTLIPRAWVREDLYYAVFNTRDGVWEPGELVPQPPPAAVAAVRKWMADNGVTSVRDVPDGVMVRLTEEATRPAAKPRARKKSGSGRPSGPG